MLDPGLMGNPAALRTPPPDFSALGLAANPFESVRPGTSLEWVAWPAGLRDAIAARSFRLQLVGLPGSGKTTLLRAVEAALRPSGLRVAFVNLRADSGLPADAADADVVLVDELSHRLATRILQLARAVRQRRQSLIAGAHRSRAGLLALGGVRVKTLQLNRAPPLEWISLRIASATLRGKCPPDLAPWLPALVRACGGVNFRVQRVLYELVEDLARGQVLDAAAVRGALDRARSFFDQDAL